MSGVAAAMVPGCAYVQAAVLSEVDLTKLGDTVTPESLMAYCEVRLRGLDTQVQSAYAKQMGANKASGALSTLQQKLNACSGKGIGMSKQDSGGDKATCKDVTDAYDAAIKELPEGKEKEALILAKGNFVADADNGSVDPADITRYADTVGSIQKDFNGISELNMINLQSLMSQRQMAVQLCTNMMNVLNDTLKAPINNIK